MGFLQQTRTLTSKNLLIALRRHFLATIIRAFVLPVGYMIFLTFARNLFISNDTFGVGSGQPVRTLAQGLAAADGGRNNLVFVNNGLSGGDIDRVIDLVATTVPPTITITRLTNSSDILTVCRSSLRGVTQCYGAVIFNSSPTEGRGGLWNYTMRADGALGTVISVDSHSSDAEIYLLPLQRAVDYAIASINTTINSAALPSTVLEYSYTDLTQAEFETKIRVAFQDTIIHVVAVAFLVGLVGVVYHETGFIATERELGMSQLIEAMMPNRRRWEPQLARIMSYHLAFDIIYLPGWLIMGAVLGSGLWSDTNRGIVIIHHLLAGLALSSWSIFGAAAFKRAQLSGITVSIITLLLGILAQVIASGKSGTGKSASVTVAILSLLFPPCNYVFFLITLARYEQQELPTDLLHGAPNSWNTPGIALWIFLVIAIFVFPILGMFIERRVHGTASKGRTVTTSNSSLTDQAPESQMAAHSAVELRNFSKHYPPSWIKRRTALFRKEPPSTVIAVNDLTLTATKGQILVLLGANGSGKSTTLDAIVGMNTITSGTVTVDGTGGVGICPQKNILWPEVKVSEHIRIFNRLKTCGNGDGNEVLRDLIKAIDLDRKLHAKAKTLSGGQKRKLQLGMMLTGGSSVCAVDEVSSGLDPLSRRKIWDILLAERGRRTIILTTHFLDEADLLADHIIILSKGTLRAQGSSAELKNTIGGGYRIHLYTGPGHRAAPAIPGIRTDVSFDQTTYSARSCTQAAQVVRTLENEGIDDYNLSGPTIEDVFMQLAEEVRSESNPDLSRGLSSQTPDVDMGEKLPKVGTVLVKSETGKLELLSGTTIGFGRQAWVLFRKRFTLLRRNYMPYIAAFIIPIIASGLVTNLIKEQGQAGCSPGDQVSDRVTQTTGNRPTYDIVIGPPSIFSQALKYLPPLFLGFGTGSNASQTIGSLYDQNSFHVVDTESDFTSYISTNYANVTPGGVFLGDSTSPPIFAYQADATIYTSVFGQNIMDTLLTNISIVTQFKRFDIPWSADTGNSLQLVVYFGLVMAAAPAFFSLYPTFERIRHIRGLQYSNGVRALPLWLAYLLFDFSIVLFSMSIVGIIFAAVAGQVWYQLGYLYLVLVLYNLVSILIAYIVSLYARTQLSAFAFAAGGQAVLFLVYLIGYLCTITYAPVTSVDYDLLALHFGVSVVTPMGSLIRALFVALNLFSTTCDGTQLASYPGGIKYYGGPILYLILQIFALSAFLVLHDSNSLFTRLRGSGSPPPTTEEAIVKDEKVVEELNRVNTSDDSLRLIHVTKSFGRNIAVEDLTFGIGQDEVFALLGPNGAGKSTTISLIRGDIQPSRNGGQIFVDDIQVSKHRAQARSHLGVCPQFDAMDALTVTEHLQFYARVRGVSDVEHNVRAVIQAVSLQNFASRMAAQLSGGNKRKLSLAIALMGNPAVLLLDEPSSGMDAVAKRIMWKTLAGVVVGRSILLTTHSMEEAGALANRAGIMSKRMLAMGTTDYLRRKHGAAYHCHLVTKTAPDTSDEEMTRLRNWMVQQFPDADMEPKSYYGQLRFAVPASSERLKRVPNKALSGDEIASGPEMPSIDGGVGVMLALLEDHREELRLAHYAVSPTTLDQVFLSIVEKHNVEEENYAVKTPRWYFFGS